MPSSILIMCLVTAFLHAACCILFSAKNSDILTKHTHIHIVELHENALFQICLTTTKPFSPIYLEDMKNYWSLNVSRTVSQVIMRVHKPKVEYKLALQEKPQGSNLDVLL